MAVPPADGKNEDPEGDHGGGAEKWAAKIIVILPLLQFGWQVAKDLGLFGN
ncbi:hypothetical protein AB0442_29620 [Kitasatospora sp. NPDC085895]|uniref:hypothetical protein n=1 Tax=Kitasatospora sp. NPDC085895 TaxID=3155057 RepID=UPI00344BDD72